MLAGMQSADFTLEAARGGDEQAFARLIAPHRRELRAHCYRMSGSLSDADDLLQETFVRAWKGLPRFEGNASLRTWLYKVATSACLDALESKSRRLLPADLGPPAGPSGSVGEPLLEPVWLEPCPEEFYTDVPTSPEARYSARESVALAFLVALQLLPAKQRAALILHDVLGWRAAQCAELLDTSIAAINSALQRARETIAQRAGALRAAPPTIDDATTRVLAKYMHAWELADVSMLVSLLHDDATLAMPPLPGWLQGARAIGASIAAMVFDGDARGRYRLLKTNANGVPAYAAYGRAADGALRPVALHVLELQGDRIGAITAFMNPALFAAFGLPATLAG